MYISFFYKFYQLISLQHNFDKQNLFYILLMIEVIF